MMVVGIYVAQQDWQTVDAVHDYVDLAVVEQVLNAAPRLTVTTASPGSLDRRHQLEFAIAQIVIEQRALCVALSPLGMLIDLWE